LSHVGNLSGNEKLRFSLSVFISSADHNQSPSRRCSAWWRGKSFNEAAAATETVPHQKSFSFSVGESHQSGNGGGSNPEQWYVPSSTAANQIRMPKLALHGNIAAS